jgi:hypothetical protein
MSAIGEAFRTKLLTYTAVSNIVGQRMYPDVLALNCQLPAILFYCSYTEREHYLGGLTKFASARFTVECYGSTRSACATLSNAIRNTGIDAFRGVVSGYTFCGVEYDSSDEYRYEAPTDGNIPVRYLCSFDLTIHYKEI